MKFWTVVDAEGCVYVFNTAFIKAVGQEKNWVAVYDADSLMRRFEYPTENEARSVINTFLMLVEA